MAAARDLARDAARTGIQLDCGTAHTGFAEIAGAGAVGIFAGTRSARFLGCGSGKGCGESGGWAPAGWGPVRGDVSFGASVRPNVEGGGAGPHEAAGGGRPGRRTAGLRTGRPRCAPVPSVGSAA
ncbi:hypothetical protein Sgou_29590 [Streptomyces gougerotii]|uniref:Uncharacterized protein n=2 Tax=Streptomyces diastaticus group TaxID=2849069 RepID=A0A8H9LRL1_9ACTN|nr:hypothetical protein Sdia_04770 [Streptomyces diastaticus subsp. diastaticus]GFH78289.1 hypothetical protein Sgou_29590 [Streptomyces gougerotii]GGU19097.1 hypothetical protein GCM10015534_22360 [Streptomyces diastaticus subsp. diastaticus]GGU69922.1 hypothetical protein GCM10010227_24810 [Streptomyces gougerotii]